MFDIPLYNVSIFRDYYQGGDIMIGILITIGLIVLLFKICGFAIKLCGKILGSVFSVVGYLLVGVLGVLGFGLTIFIFPIVLVVAIIAIIVAISKVA